MFILFIQCFNTSQTSAAFLLIVVYAANLVGLNLSRRSVCVLVSQCVGSMAAWGAGMWPWPASTSCCAFWNNEATDDFHNLGACWGSAAWFDYESPQDIFTIHWLLIKPTRGCDVASGVCVYEEQSVCTFLIVSVNAVAVSLELRSPA